jgi:hypothetical protein
LLVGFLMVNAPLGVAHNDGSSAGVLEHFGREVTRESALRLAVTILSPNTEWRIPRGLGKREQESGWRAHYKVYPAKRSGAFDDRRELPQGIPQPIHFPIARHQRTPCGHVLSSPVLPSCRFSSCPALWQASHLFSCDKGVDGRGKLGHDGVGTASLFAIKLRQGYALFYDVPRRMQATALSPDN